MLTRVGSIRANSKPHGDPDIGDEVLIARDNHVDAAATGAPIDPATLITFVKC